MITVTIDAVDRTSSIVAKSPRKNERISDRAGTFRFLLRKYGTKTYKPSLGDEISVADGATTVFAGVVTKIEERLKSPFVLEYMIICKDYSHLLSRQLVTQRYTNQSVEDIISDLITNYTTDSFTTNNVVATKVINSISFNRITVAQAIQKLADIISFTWYVDYAKDIHFFAKDGEIESFTLTDSSNNYIYSSLVIKQDIEQLRNRVLVEGGDKEVADRSVTITGADLDAEGQYVLPYKFAGAPTITVDAVTQTVGTDFLSDDASFDVMWDFNTRHIRFTTGNIPTSGQAVVITGTPLIPIIVEVPDDASIDEFGAYEYHIKDKTIRTENEAIERSLAELDAYASELTEGEFKTRTDGFRAGQVIRINSTQRGIDEKMVVQSVDMNVEDNEGTRKVYKIKFASLKTLGVIDVLRRLLLDEEIKEGEDQILITLLRLSDSLTITDTLSAPTATSGPYYWEPISANSPGGKWNFATWA